LLVSLGANDPEFNLLEAKAFILHTAQADKQTFVSITEAHGNVDPINETITDAQPKVENLMLQEEQDGQLTVRFVYKGKSHAYTLRDQTGAQRGVLAKVPD